MPIAASSARTWRIFSGSATIANPRELTEELIASPVHLIDRSGAPRGEKYFVFYNPPVVNQELGIRRSYINETRRIAGSFLKRGLQTIVFTTSRLNTEILVTYLKQEIEITTELLDAACRTYFLDAPVAGTQAAAK